MHNIITNISKFENVKEYMNLIHKEENFFVIHVRRIFDGSVYLKSNLFLTNNSNRTFEFQLV